MCVCVWTFILFLSHSSVSKSTIQKNIKNFFFYLKVKIFSKWKCKNVFMFNFFILFFFSSPLLRHIYSLHIVDLCIYKTLFLFFFFNISLLIFFSDFSRRSVLLQYCCVYYLVGILPLTTVDAAIEKSFVFVILFFFLWF